MHYVIRLGQSSIVQAALGDQKVSYPCYVGFDSYAVSVHPTLSHLFMATSKTTASFFSYSARRGELLAASPGSVDKEFGKSSGHLTQALFLRARR